MCTVISNIHIQYCRGFPKKKDSHWLSGCRNRDIIPEHRDAMRDAKIAKGLTPGSQPLFVFLYNQRSRKAAYQAAKTAERGERDARGLKYSFYVAGGNHQFESSHEAGLMLEADGDLDKARKVRTLACHVCAWPNYPDNEEGRHKICDTIRQVCSILLNHGRSIRCTK